MTCCINRHLACQKFVFKPKHPCGKKCTHFDDTDEVQEFLKIMDCFINDEMAKVRPDAEKTWHLIIILIIMWYNAHIVLWQHLEGWDWALGWFMRVQSSISLRFVLSCLKKTPLLVLGWFICLNGLHSALNSRCYHSGTSAFLSLAYF